MGATAAEKNRALRIGPVALDERIDPTDPDEVGALAGRVTASSDILVIMNENRARYKQLGPVMQMRPDIAASETLDLDEVADVAGVNVEGASVRGKGDAKVVIYLTRVGNSDFGRSTRGMIPYDEKLSKSRSAYEARLDREREAKEAVEHVTKPAPPTGANPAQMALEQRLAALEAELASVRAAEKAREETKRENPEMTAADDDDTGDKLKKGQTRAEDPGTIDPPERENPGQTAEDDLADEQDDDSPSGDAKADAPKRGQTRSRASGQKKS